MLKQKNNANIKLTFNNATTKHNLNNFCHSTHFAAGALVGKNVTFCSARYNFKMCDFISAVLPPCYE